MMCCTKFQKNCAKKWKRVTASKWTILFAITRILIFLIISVFQLVIFVRNLGYSMNIESDSKCLDDIDNDSSIVIDLLHVLYVCLENLLCVLFQFFQMYFGFNALFHEQAFQLIAIVVFDLGWALYGIGQALTMKYFRDKINKISSCRQVYPYDLTFRYFDIPYTVIYFVLALLSAFISFKLYQQLSWNIYKKIGADLSMKKLYMKRLVSTTLLKYELYFFLLFLMLNGIRLFGGADDPRLKAYWNYHSIESVLVFFMALLAYQSIRLEWKIGMYIFFVLWITYILDAIFVVVASAYVHWYFLTFWALLFIILALATIVYGVLLMKGFGKGLKKFFVKSSAKPTSPGEEEANIETQTEVKSNFNPTKKWAIED